MHKTIWIVVLTFSFLVSCISQKPEGLMPAQPAETTVKVDYYARPIPEIPLPNDLATRFDATSATKRRINASLIADTQLETRVRELLDQMDGWGTFQPITIPFTGPLDLNSITEGHRDLDYATENDRIYLVNVTKESPKFGQLTLLDVGNGNYPITLEDKDYWPNDPRGDTTTLLFEETFEDLNGNGVLDLGEDINGNGILDAGEDVNGNGFLDLPEDLDADGILDIPNYLDGANPDMDDLAARADAMMTFYERETNTLIVRPLVPLEERTTYAVVVTKRILDINGKPVGSPYDFINHTSQTEDLKNIVEVMPEGLELDDIAFAYTFTTQTVASAMVAVRDGLYGHGVQGHLGRDFPAELHTLEQMRDEDYEHPISNYQILYSEEWQKAFRVVMQELGGVSDFDHNETEKLGELVYQYIDYFVVGSFQSPQLFERYDEDGNWLPLNDQAWPEDLDQKAAPAVGETVYFTLAVPRKEISARGEGGQVPVVIQSHGYGGNRFDGVQYAGFHAKFGMATLSIDGPGHGLGMDDLQIELSRSIMSNYGLVATSDAFHKDRTFNQNNDALNKGDSGADFWTAYLFHTRDVVRQFALDYMQLIRVIRSFDGIRKWKYDVDGNGAQELAGDFDADGQVDVGSDSPIHMVGGSLGGIMSMVMAGVEPELTSVSPVAGGGGYADMGPRTAQRGAIEGFVLRAMAPVYLGTTDEDGSFRFETLIPDLNHANTLPVATVEGVNPWDTIVVENLINGELGCGYVQADGTFRGSVASDLHDAHVIRVYAGPQLAGGEECELRGAVEPKLIVDAFEEDRYFQGTTYPAGEPLMAMAEGFGMRRATSRFRKFTGIGQLVLEPADPVNYARFALEEPLYFPGTQQETGTHVLQITTLGDLAVPATSGATYGRAAGLIGYTGPKEKFGKSENQVLIDTHTIEAVNTLNRYTNGEGKGVHLDIANLSEGNDMFGPDQPRMTPAARFGFDELDPLGGKSSSLFVMGNPTGQHGFDWPRSQTQRMIERCLDTCEEPEGEEINTNRCECRDIAFSKFDVGTFMLNLVGRYFQSEGTVLEADQCLSRDDCEGGLLPPLSRDTTTMP